MSSLVIHAVAVGGSLHLTICEQRSGLCETIRGMQVKAHACWQFFSQMMNRRLLSALLESWSNGAH
jgi:hypothetical protein